MCGAGPLAGGEDTGTGVRGNAATAGWLCDQGSHQLELQCPKPVETWASIRHVTDTQAGRSPEAGMASFELKTNEEEALA